MITHTILINGELRMNDLIKYQRIFDENKIMFLIGVFSVILLIISFILNLVFNHYRIMNEYWGSILIFLITLISFIVYFYFIFQIVKKKNNSMANVIIMLIYISLAVLIILCNHIYFGIRSG